MIIGFTADRYRMLSVPFILRLLRWCGVSFSEVTVNALHRPGRTQRSSRGMALALHLPNLGNCGYDFSSARFREKIESVLLKIQRSREAFGFRYAVFHPPEDDSVSESFDFYVQNLVRVGIPLVLENVRTYDANRFGAFYRRLKKALGPDLHGICVDIPHAHLAGEDWVQFFRAFGSEVRVVHLSDCKGEMDFHYPFGIGGDLCLEAILEKLKALGFDGVLNFEMLPPSLRDVESYFDAYLQARHAFHPAGMERAVQRMRWTGLLARRAGTLLKMA